MAERRVADLPDTPGMPPGNPGWETWTKDAGAHVSVTPLLDLVSHSEDPDGECICGPTVSLERCDDGTEYWQIVHHSLDGRERFEP